MIARMTKQLPPALLGPPRPRSLLDMFLFARAHLLQRSMLYIFLPPNSIKQTAYADTAATAISAGGQHTCAVLAVGGMTCWGSNSWAQCTVPSGLGTVSRVAASIYDTVALRSDGTVAMWGKGSGGPRAPLRGIDVQAG